MIFLADTHALIWYSLDDPKLKTAARILMQTTTNDVLVSPASFWEIAIKISNGRLALQRTFNEFVDVCLNHYKFRLLPIEPAHTARVASLPYPTRHKDPFDRLLVAQALVEGIPILSADPALDPYGVQRLW